MPWTKVRGSCPSSACSTGDRTTRGRCRQPRATDLDMAAAVTGPAMVIVRRTSVTRRRRAAEREYGAAERVPAIRPPRFRRLDRSRSPGPAQTPAIDHRAHAGVTVGNQRVQVGTAPAQRIQAAQHVVADGDVDGAQLEQVEREGLAVVGGGDEACDARDLAGVARLRRAAAGGRRPGRRCAWRRRTGL